MGVPALFRWLSKKYPKIISPVIEENGSDEFPQQGQYSDPNPNGEIDNLYLDMNGIVHPCSHPEHKPAPETEDEMFLDIFEYTDRVLMMARPRKVLMIAVDGVAPRAKMNQQRARRFRSAQDAKIKEEEKERELQEMELRGEKIEQSFKTQKAWDSNAITPGTPFMDRLAQALRYWVAYKLANDPGWAELQVIISDATVPGEGEHKLMSFIRSQRSDPSYDPNTKHCIYGLDADLIFLGLATHEPHFRVLREDVFAGNNRSMTLKNQLSMTKEEEERIRESDKRKPFLWLHVSVLREYLAVELQVRGFRFELERALDDWVFMCFFVGNDFLPHLPSLDVRDNGIDILIGCWKRVLPQIGDYITRDGVLNLPAVEKLMGSLSYKEADIFRRRHENEVRREENFKRRKVAETEEKQFMNQYLPTVSKGKDKGQLAPDTNMPLMTTSGEVVEGYANLSNKDIVQNRDVITLANMANEEAAKRLRGLIEKDTEKVEGTEKSIEKTDTEETPEVSTPSEKRSADDVDSVDSSDPRLYEPGYRDRYYKTKFHCADDAEVEKTRREVVRSYLEGISWVLLYYYQGCPSWDWYYPYHYAPFAADFTNIDEIVGPEGIVFVQGEPFRPFEQLMSVLPAASGHNLPDVFRPLMSNPDSAIIDFYPEDFAIDMNGKKMSWQGIALLPFIDEERLLRVVRAQYKHLTDDEKDRNTNKNEVLFISRANKNFDTFADALYKNASDKVVFRHYASGLAGIAGPRPEYQLDGKMAFPLKEGDMPDVDNSEYMQVEYSMPHKKPGKSMLLHGFIPHKLALTEDDIDKIQNPSYSRFNNGQSFRGDREDYINKGPKGTKCEHLYTKRRGGYRALLTGEDEPRDQRSQGKNNSQGNGYNKGYNANGYNANGYNANGYNAYGNQGYGNQNYGNQGYGQNYGNQGYGQNYQGHNQGYNNYNRNSYGKQYQGNQGNQYQGNHQGNQYQGNQGNSYQGNQYQGHRGQGYDRRNDQRGNSRYQNRYQDNQNTQQSYNQSYNRNQNYQGGSNGYGRDRGVGYQ